jgi:hypothetical protein
MPPLNGESYKSRPSSSTDRMRTSTDLRPEQQGLFASFDRAQPITFLPWLAGKLGLKSHVESPKVTYQAPGQHGNVHTRAWLTRDLRDHNTISLLTDVVHVGSNQVHELVADSEQIQATVTRDGAMTTDQANLASREAMFAFIGNSQDTAELVGREVMQVLISRPPYMTP